MLRRYPVTHGALNALTLSAVLVLPFASALAAQSTATKPSPTTSDAPVDAMALYNQGAAVVQDRRELDLTAGAQQIPWPVHARLRPDTLWLEGEGVTLTGFSAASDSTANADPLAARIGSDVTLVRDASADDEGATRQATLVAVRADSVYVRVDDRIERLTTDSPWQITWAIDGVDQDHDKTADGGLRLTVDANKAGTVPVTATYQIDGPSWQASYTGRYDAATGKLALASMAVIDNSGGAHLAADKAWLVAGDVARAGRGGPQPVAMMARSEAKMADGAPEAAGDTYRYALDGALDVPAGGVRAVSMMKPAAFDASRRYRFDHYWYANGDDSTRDHAEIRLSFDNTSDKPLPAGAIRIYDGQSQARLMGEDRIGDTPKDAPVALTLGRAFDITSARQVVSEQTTDAGQRERVVKITLYNASDRQAAIDVVEQLPDGAKIVSASISQADDSAANTGRWAIDLNADSQRQLVYTVQWPANNG